MIPAQLAQDWKTAVLEYVDTVFPFSNDQLREAWLNFLKDPDEGLFKGFYIHSRLPYRVADASQPIPLTAVQPFFRPFVHQLRAFERLNSVREDGPQPTLVTTGTGSGKTESFLYPIIDHCVRMRKQGKEGIKAIILYPMNALAHDQAKRLADLIHKHPEAKHSITAGIYVGQGRKEEGEPQSISRVMTEKQLIEDRKILRKHPPDILLTNYKMLDLLLHRKSDASLWGMNQPDTLTYLVLDEMHAYDGVQLADIACLIRRLLARLHMKPAQLCPVGTSATLGDGSEQTKAKLIDLAATVFGRSLDTSSVVTEDRPTLSEFLLPIETDAVPEPATLTELLPKPLEDTDSYVSRQLELWFGEQLDSSETGRRLRAHAWFQVFCQHTHAEPITWEQLVQRFQKEWQGSVPPEAVEPLLCSLLAVISFAKEESGYRPLLPIHTQLWMKEMRGLVRELDEQPRFRWIDRATVDFSLSKKDKGYIARFDHATLPMIVCNSCGVGGWVAIQHDADPRLETDPYAVNRVYGRTFHASTSDEEKKSIRFLFPQSEGEPEPGHSQWYITKKEAILADKPGKERLPIYVVKPFARDDTHRCPYCSERNSMLLVSMRRASLSSVIIAQTVSSAHTKDRKILSFTDSVQDAAHLAGFIRYRTKSTILRTALNQMLLNGYERKPLAELLTDFQTYWRTYFAKTYGTAGDEQYLRAFVERDEEEEQLAGRFPRNRSEWTDKIWEEVEFYITWKLLKELGLHARLGRSLYLTGSVALQLDPQKLEEAVKGATESVQAREPQLNWDGKLSERVRAFIQGVAHRMAIRGGISHPLLDAYRESGGNRYLLSEEQNRLYEGSKRQPRFYTTSGKLQKDGFDPVYGGKESWLTQYVQKVFLPEQDFQLIESIDEGNVASRIFHNMQQAGLLDIRHHQSSETFGLSQEALLLTKDTTRVQCKSCHYELTLAVQDKEEFEQKVPCISYRCHGHYLSAPKRTGQFYERVYEEWNLEPVISKEHSSLVSTAKRKEVEKRFSEGKPSPVNVLVCTPTMEMGIDIGDLSTVLLTNVPPSIASRVQRVGRAGRSTGTAIVAQVFRDSPHDHYFWEDPSELLNGRVETPVCLLDAPEVLKRHLCAFLLDAWIRDKSEAEIPLHVSRVLTEEKLKAFPYHWFSYVDSRREMLWEEFTIMFVEQLKERNVQIIYNYFIGEEWKDAVQHVIATRRDEVKEASNHLLRLNNRYKKLEQQGTTDEDDEKKELKRELQQARARYRELMEEETLEWWTLEGLLPNYAFPDREVTLKRFIPPASGMKATLEQFVRHPEVALRDLAPGNHFYARGRTTVINQLPLVSRELEEWRLCPYCQYMVKNNDQISHTCPRCGCQEWRDKGQIAYMVPQGHVISRARLKDETQIDDESEERTRQPMEVMQFFDFHTMPQASYRVQGQPFGYEFFERSTMREINFGPKNLEQSGRIVAQQRVPQKGFVVCEKCGASEVKDKNGRLSIRHVRGFGCERHKQQDVNKQAVEQGTNERLSRADEHKISLYLYRELESEMIRIALPIHLTKKDERYATWVAIFRLGLREKIGGSEQQIGIARYHEPIQDGKETINANYLVLYDKIPGGTGYLQQLAEQGELYDLLKRAWDRIQNCSCQHEGRDGCYHCLFRYESQYDQQYISRRLAVDMLKYLIQDPNLWEETSFLDVQNSNYRRQLLDSDFEELAEDKLVLYLEEERLPEFEKRNYVEGNQTGIEIRWRTFSGEVGWRLIRQKNLTGQDGVPFATRADWVLYPLGAFRNEELRPIVVYLDGAKYHVGDGEYNRLAQDVLIREGLRRGGKYTVFTLTWRDVVVKDSENEGQTAIYDRDPELDFEQHLKQVASHLQYTDPTTSWYHSGLQLLVDYLKQPSLSNRIKFAEAVSLVTAGVLDREKHVASVHYVGQSLNYVLVAETKASYTGEIEKANPNLMRIMDGKAKKVVFAEHHFGTGKNLSLLIAARGNKKSGYQFNGILRLEDQQRFDSEGELKDTFLRDWRIFFHWFNYLQWLPGLRFVTAESLQKHKDKWDVLDAMYPIEMWDQVQNTESEEQQVVIDPSWLDLIHPSYRQIAVALARSGVPLPEVGYEFLENDEIVDEAELAWPNEKICILRKVQYEDVEQIKKLGWTVWDLQKYSLEVESPESISDVNWSEMWDQLVKGEV
ncbi:DEAD/DEAH box helicase [Laceyella putida]|uniref:DEAD/DEAH box helicase n=1 Tax=Laceyella putida TaxID=110101 RepID=A0ABW2RQ96_9BACL